MTETSAGRQTLDEWRASVDALSDEELWEAAERANTAAFVDALQERGYAAAEIHEIFTLFARRFRTLGLLPPPDGYVDLEWLAHS